MTTLHWDRNKATRARIPTPRDKIFVLAKAGVRGVRAALVFVFNAYVEGRKRQAAQLLANYHERHPHAIADSAVVARKFCEAEKTICRDKISER